MTANGNREKVNLDLFYYFILTIDVGEEEYFIHD